MTPIFIPQSLLFAMYWCAAFIVLAESLNKLQRIDPLRRGLTRVQRGGAVLNALGWMLFAVSSGGALVSPMTGLYSARLQDAALMLGSAVFIVHRRFKEIEKNRSEPHGNDAYGRETSQ